MSSSRALVASGDGDALDDALPVISSLNDAGTDYVVLGGVAPETRYRMTRNTLRPIDRADAAALRSVFHLTEDQ